jgi:two-component system, OmpR family, sensor histidine kinase KdpD
MQREFPLFHAPMKDYVWALLAVIAVTIIGKILTPFFNLTNIVLLYLLPVLISAVRSGKGPSFFAALLGVLAYDFLFVPPVLSLTVNDARDLFVFAIYLIVALVTGAMATKLRDELEKTRQREKRMLALYALSQEIAAETDLEQVLKTFVKTVSEAINGQVSILFPDPEDDVLREVDSHPPGKALRDDKEEAVVRWVLKHGQSAGKGTEILREASQLIFPVKADEETLAVLAITLNSGEAAISSEQRRLIEAFTNLAAVAIIRVRLAEKAEQAKWLAESEKLHRALLNSISHDLRTPLASITGASTSLLAEGDVYTPEAKEIFLNTIKEEAQRMNRYVANLLDMVRLESGILKPKKEWCDIQDIMGVVVRETKDALQGRPLRIDIPPALPLVEADFTLIEQVMINLLENGAKYSPPGSEISVSARYHDNTLLFTVADSAPAIPKTEQNRVFDKFYRLHSTKHISGTGLGLSICKGIVEAHGGRIWVDSSHEYGNRFTFSLPVSEQPLEQPDIKEREDHIV